MFQSWTCRRWNSSTVIVLQTWACNPSWKPLSNKLLIKKFWTWPMIRNVVQSWNSSTAIIWLYMWKFSHCQRKVLVAPEIASSIESRQHVLDGNSLHVYPSPTPLFLILPTHTIVRQTRACTTTRWLTSRSRSSRNCWMSTMWTLPASLKRMTLYVSDRVHWAWTLTCLVESSGLVVTGRIWVYIWLRTFCLRLMQVTMSRVSACYLCHCGYYRLRWAR